ncbi:MAG: hypothetical protein BWY31_03015 [Lentisphaerae bacterium ADurb.Bin242]|nr:MAG: hypothetical protein BWY31_03015 [Lentisphaerae bacterium ADurb.Bin242]
MRKRILAFVLFASAAFCATISYAEQLNPDRPKKIIQFGLDNASPEWLEKNIDVVEKFLPYDGIGITFDEGIDKNGKKMFIRYKLFGAEKMERSWFDSYVKSLKNVKFKKLRHNFIRANYANFDGTFDLFNDKFWEDGVYNNFRILASIAKECGMEGITFDMEDYGGRKLWKYNPKCGHSYADAYTKARERGQGFIKALSDKFPEIKIFAWFWIDMVFGPADGTPFLFERLEASDTGLLVGFINGIYDGLPPEAIIIDGMEAHGYAAKNIDSFYRLRALREIRFRRMLAPENQRKLREQTFLAVGTYLDSYVNEKPPYRLENDSGMNRTGFFRRNLSLSFDFSDEYVWTWSQCRTWFPIENPSPNMIKNFQMNPSVPGPLWHDAIPGIEEAIIYARNPYEFSMTRLKIGKTSKNMVRNHDFEQKDFSSGETITPAADNVPLAKARYWEAWQPKRSKGIFSVVSGEGTNGSAAVKMEGVVDGAILQSIKADPNGVHIVRASARTVHAAGASLSVAWKNANGAWCNNSLRAFSSFHEDLGNGWKRATIFIPAVPQGTQYIVPMLFMTSSGDRKDMALFDDVEVFQIKFDADEPKK